MARKTGAASGPAGILLSELSFEPWAADFAQAAQSRAQRGVNDFARQVPDSRSPIASQYTDFSDKILLSAFQLPSPSAKSGLKFLSDPLNISRTRLLYSGESKGWAFSKASKNVFTGIGIGLF
jgi:hypothetical protein